MRKILLIVLAGTLFSGCEDVIDIDVKEGKRQLVVDAWLTDEVKEQTVKLSFTQAYFNQGSQEPALGAEVFIIKHDSTMIEFLDERGDGNYSYTPRNRRFLELDKPVALYIKYQGEEYYAVSELKRVPTIDSLKYQSITLPIKPTDGPQSGFVAQFYATDFEGEGDTYLVRSYKNDILRGKSNEFVLCYDAGFSPNSNVDGQLFIQPLRIAINSGLYVDGDKVTVELYSIPLEAYYFLGQIQQETNNGGIFATPPHNVPTNIFNRNSESLEKAVGAFFVSKVSRFAAYIDKNGASSD
jgi:hypothetical protein